MLACQTLIPSSPVSPVGLLLVKHCSVIYRCSVATYPLWISMHTYVLKHTHIPADLCDMNIWHMCLFQETETHTPRLYFHSTEVAFIFCEKVAIHCCFQVVLLKKNKTNLPIPVLLRTDAGICNCQVMSNITNIYYYLRSYK